MNKAVILLILPCLVAIATCAIYQQQYYQQNPGTYAYVQGPRNVAPYAQYAAKNAQALRQARLFNYLLGGLYFLNLFNITGNQISG